MTQTSLPEKRSYHVQANEIRWDADDPADIQGLPTSISFIFSDEDLAEDDIESLIADKITEVTGFCHDGFDYIGPMLIGQ